MTELEYSKKVQQVLGCLLRHAEDLGHQRAVAEVAMKMKDARGEQAARNAISRLEDAVATYRTKLLRTTRATLDDTAAPRTKEEWDSMIGHTVETRVQNIPWAQVTVLRAFHVSGLATFYGRAFRPGELVIELLSGGSQRRRSIHRRPSEIRLVSENDLRSA